MGAVGNAWRKPHAAPVGQPSPSRPIYGGNSAPNVRPPSVSPRNSAMLSSSTSSGTILALSKLNSRGSSSSDGAKVGSPVGAPAQPMSEHLAASQTRSNSCVEHATHQAFADDSASHAQQYAEQELWFSWQISYSQHKRHPQKWNDIHGLRKVRPAVHGRVAFLSAAMLGWKQVLYTVFRIDTVRTWSAVSRGSRSTTLVCVGRGCCGCT